MQRKDCENLGLAGACEHGRRSARSARVVVSVVLALGWPGPDLMAGTVRLWPSAVIVNDTVHLSDLAELRAFEGETERQLASLVVTQAPPPGGSRIIHMEMIRSVLAGNGANMATVTLSGATQCSVTRPVNSMAASPEAGSGMVGRPGSHSSFAKVSMPASPSQGEQAGAGAKASTLRRAVIDYFNAEFARYGGHADVVFDRTSDQVLDLSGPVYQFRVQRRGGSPLGLTQLEVEVSADGRAVQTVPLVAQVSLVRRVVVARRAVNQDATIKASDVELVPVSFTRLDRLGLDDPAYAVGQRAKRFIAAGGVLDAEMMELVPLVTRGQLVTLTSVSGAVKVVTSATATQDGLLGETISVRAADNRRIEVDAVVVGPGAVQIGSGPAGRRIPQRAGEDQP